MARKFRADLQNASDSCIGHGCGLRDQMLHVNAFVEDLAKADEFGPECSMVANSIDESGIVVGVMRLYGPLPHRNIGL